MNRRSAFLEVAKTYPIRPAMWLAALFYAPVLIACAYLVVGYTPRHSDTTEWFWLTLSFPMAYVLGIITGHLKEQFTQPLTRLIPGHYRPHLVMACLVALFLLAIPMVAVLRLGDSALGSAALLTVMAVSVAWVTYVNTGLPALLLIAGYFSVVRTTAGRHLLADLVGGQTPGIACALLLAGMGGGMLLAFRLSRLTEEQPEYHRPVLVSTWHQRQRMTGLAPQAWRSRGGKFAVLWAGPSERIIGLASRAKDGKLWHRVRLRQVVLSRDAFGLLMILCIMIFTVVFPKWMGLMIVLMQVQWLVIVPVIVALQRLRAWRGSCESELLRPVSRERFLIESGLAQLLAIMSMWLYILAAYAVVALVLPAPSFWSAQNLATVALTGACQVVFLAVSAWILRRGWSFTTHLPVMICVGVLTALAMALSDAPGRFLGPMGILCIAAMLVVLGAFITRDAYRRWLLTEIG